MGATAALQEDLRNLSAEGGFLQQPLAFKRVLYAAEAQKGPFSTHQIHLVPYEGVAGGQRGNYTSGVNTNEGLQSQQIELGQVQRLF